MCWEGPQELIAEQLSRRHNSPLSTAKWEESKIKQELLHFDKTKLHSEYFLMNASSSYTNIWLIQYFTRDKQLHKNKLAKLNCKEAVWHLSDQPEFQTRNYSERSGNYNQIPVKENFFENELIKLQENWLNNLIF